MSQLENPTSPYYMAVPLGAFLLSRTPRFSKHFVGASTCGLALSAAAGSISIALGSGRFSDECLGRFIPTMALMILGNLSALGVAKALKGRISLSFPGTLKLIAIEGVCNGIFTITLHSQPKETQEPLPELNKAVKGIMSLPKRVFNHMLLNLSDPETILYARLSYAKKLEEEGSLVNKKDFVRDPSFWKMYFCHHFSSVRKLTEKNEEVYRKVCSFMRMFFTERSKYPDLIGRAIDHNFDKIVYRELPERTVRFDMRLLETARNKGYEKIVETILAVGAIAAARTPHSTFRELLAAKASVDAKDTYGRTPLHEAVWSQHSGNAKVLLEERAAVDVKDNLGKTPLHEAALYSVNSKITRALLEEGAAVDERDNKGRTALHIAAYYGRIENIQALLEAKASVDLRTSYGNTPLDLTYDEDICVLLRRAALSA